MRIICTCFLLLALGFLSSLRAQDIFIKFTGPEGIIAGESLQEGFRDHVESLSYAQASTAACATSTGGSREGCMANTGNLFFVVRFDKSLNVLRKHMYRGTPLPRVEIFFVKNVSELKSPVYYSIRMDGVHLASISDAKSNTNDPNTVQIELDPEKIGWTYYPQSLNGGTVTPVKFGWDRTNNTEWAF